MSNWRTTQEYLQYQEETAIPKLRWWQVQSLVQDNPNDADLGGKVRQLVTRNTN
jgi:hypothetical protein